MSQKAWPASPRELLEARYRAYVDGDVDFILESVHPEKTRKHDRKSIEAWSKNAKWKAMQVEKEEGGPADDRAWLTFRLQYEEGGQAIDHRERAEFRIWEGRWYYYDSKFPRGDPVKRDPEKVGRNEPCPCGSGKKFKKCCGAG